MSTARISDPYFLLALDMCLGDSPVPAGFIRCRTCGSINDKLDEPAQGPCVLCGDYWLEVDMPQTFGGGSLMAAVVDSATGRS